MDGTEPSVDRFGWATTSWSRIARAGRSSPQERREGLELLCRQYWGPIAGYMRRALKVSAEETEDLMQDFFVHLLERDVMERADPEVGRFRHYIKEILRNFVLDSRRREGRLKRGGGRAIVSIEAAREEGRVLDVAGSPSPEEALDRNWARRVFEIALERLESILIEEGRSEDLDLFRRYIAPLEGESRPTYRDLGEPLGLSEWVVWKRLGQLRERLRSALGEEVERTVVEPGQVPEEVDLLTELLL